MSSHHRTIILCLAFTIGMTCLAYDHRAHANPIVTDGEVAQAIDRLKACLYKLQNPDGSWEDQFAQSEQAGGETAIITLALLHAGESAQQPALARAIDWLKPRPGDTRFRGTYAVAARAHVWAFLADHYQPLLQADARWLLDQGADDQSRFWYTAHPSGWDNSATHFGLLGVWEAAKRGVHVPPSFWQNAAAHFITTQNPDGGWPYQDGKSYGSMTTAGLASLYIVQEQLHRTARRPDPDLTRSITRGATWLDERFQGATNIALGGRTEYYLYGIERVALAGGYKHLRGQDWYRTGARYYIDTQKADGSVARTGYDNAFALLFLARGRVPLWIAKLRLPNQHWNNHPLDIANLTRWIAHEREAELNWQAVDIDSPAESWLDSPLLFLSSDQPVKLDEAQRARLKQYLDRGGLLIANPDDASPEFSQSVIDLIDPLYPAYDWRPLERDHALYQTLYQIDPDQFQSPVRGLSNGARELALLLPDDWGYVFQSQAGEDDPRFEAMLNLWALVSDRGVLRNRLDTPYEQRRATNPAPAPPPATATQPRTINIARVALTNAAHTLAEPAALDALGDRLWNRASVNLNIVDQTLAQLNQPDAGGPRIAHLAGVDAVELSPQEILDMHRFARDGGTLIIETIAGRGNFARSIEQQLRIVFQGAPLPLALNARYISGEGIAHSYDLRHINYRRATLAREDIGHTPRLLAFYVAGKPAVILSHKDLSLGLLGMRRWHIDGYDIESSRRIMTNLTLHANQRAVQHAKQNATQDQP